MANEKEIIMYDSPEAGNLVTVTVWEVNNPNGKIMFRKLYYRIFKRYKRLEIKFVNYAEGDRMIKETWNKP